MEHPPVLPVVEMFPNSIQEPQLQVSNRPDLARTWFIHEDENQIIQVQRDRFTFNWRKAKSNQQYPGFSTILKRFETFYNRFERMQNTVTELEVGDGNSAGIAVYELTIYRSNYFRAPIILPTGTPWNTLDGIGFKNAKIFNLFVDSPQLNSFWSGVESLILRTSFRVENLHGRLHLTIGNRVRSSDQKQTLQTDFTVRGFPESVEHTMITWFKSAHDEICRKFACMFSEYIQLEIWERKS